MRRARRRPYRACALSKKVKCKTGFALVGHITDQPKGHRFEAPLPAQIKTTGVVLAVATKNVDWRAGRAKYADTLPLEVMNAVRERLKMLLDLER